MRFDKAVGRWRIQGWPLVESQWRLYRTRSYRDRVVTGAALCVGRYTVVAERGKATS